MPSFPPRPASSPAASISTNTRRAYRTALARLDTWLAGRALDDSSLAAYLADIHDAGRSPATAAQVVAAVKFRAKLAGLASPLGPATDRVLAGLRREGRGRGRGQVTGVSWAQADAAAAVAANDGGSIAGLRDAAILALASDAMLRVSEVAALDVDDVRIEDDGTGRLTVRHSKTDQEGAGTVLFLGAATVARIKAWQACAGVRGGALFRRVRRGGWPQNERISARAIRTVIAKRAANAGVEGRVSGHSLRVGSAQSPRRGRCRVGRASDGWAVDLARDAGAVLARPIRRPRCRRPAALRRRPVNGPRPEGRDRRWQSGQGRRQDGYT